MSARPSFLLVTALVCGCGGPLAQLRPGTTGKEKLEGMRALLTAPDEVKVQAVPRLLELAGARREDVRVAAFQTLDELHFSDARSAWGRAVRDAKTCGKVVRLTKARWETLSMEQREGLLSAVVTGPCKDKDAWLWELVEADDPALHPGSTLYVWADKQRAEPDTARLLKQAAKQGGPGQIATLCELLSARDLEGTARYDALKLIHNPWAPLSVRTVLGERLMKRLPPLEEPALRRVLGSSHAPSVLRKQALVALAGDPPKLTDKLATAVGEVVADAVTPPDARAWFAERLAERKDEGTFRVFRGVAQDVRAPRDLRARMLGYVVEYADDAASRVLASVVRQEASHMETRALALAGMAKVWSQAAETTCVELCARRPFSELCLGAVERLREHGSARLAQARAFGFAARLRNAEDPATVLSLRRELDDATLAALPAPAGRFVQAVGGIFEADAAYAATLGGELEKIDGAVCTMRDGWNNVNAAKAAGKADQAKALQREMYWADNLLRDPATKSKLNSARRAAAGPLQAAAVAAAALQDPELSRRAKMMREEGKWLRARCTLLPAFARAKRAAKVAAP